MQGISPKQVVFHPREVNLAACRRRTAGTPGHYGIAIDQVSKYLGVVYQEDGSWQARAKALAKMQAAYGYWRPLLCSSLPTKVRLLMVQTFIYSAVMYGAEVWDTTKAVKDKMSAVVKKALRSILALHPETALLTFCTGTLGYFHGVLDAAKLCGSTDARTWRLADGPRRRCDSHSRVAVVSAGLRWADWCGNVKSITEQIQHT
jgi:hypothetical protein